MDRIHHSNCPLCEGKNKQPFLSVKDHSISGEPFELAICKDCDFLFTQDAPSESAIAPYYESEDYISHSDTKKGLVDRLYHLARSFMLKSKQKTVEQLAAGKKLLDIGSGTGYFLHHMQSAGWEVTGIEPSEAGRSFAQKQFGLNVYPTDELFTLEKGQYDAITMWHVLEHIHDMHRYMEMIHTLLTEQGLLVIALPNHTSYDAHHYRDYWAAYDVPRHLWHFSPKTLERLAHKHGFRLIGIKRMPLDAFYVSMLSEKYKRSSLGLFKGIFTGMISNIKSLGGKKRCSSLIYLLKKG